MTAPVPLPVDLRVFDWAALRNEDACEPGFYFGVSRWSDANGPWEGCAVYESIDGGITWNLVARMTTAAVMGYTETALDMPSTPRPEWDRGSTVRVRVNDGELESRPEADVLNGRNWAIVGSEVIAFQNATLVEAGLYDLDTLLRGRRATELAITEHVTREPFLLLEPNRLAFRRIEPASIGLERQLKAVAPGGELATVPVAVALPFYGHNARPFPVAHLEASRDSSDNITATWLPRSRGIFAPFDGVDHRLCCCDDDLYALEFYNGGTLTRRVEVSGVAAHTYTEAQQIADGLTPPVPLDLKLYQKSTLVGLGHVAEVTIP